MPRLGFGAPIEALWLLTIVSVPLVFGPPGWLAFFEVPKIALMRTLVALILAAWTLDVALRVAARGLPAALGWRGRAAGWLNAYPPRWTLVAAAATALVAAASTLASPVPLTALWGFEQGGEGRSLLSIASVLALFFAIALRLRSERMAWRLVAAVGLVTAVAAGYVVVQGFGMDPFELGRLLPGRVVGSFGNPIFAAAALLMGLPLILAGALAAAAWRSPVVSLAVGAGAAGVTATAITLTMARGPWVGAIVAVGIFLAVGWRILPPHLRRRLVVLSAASAAVALGLLATINDPRGGGASLSATVERAGSIPAATSDGLTGRRQIWETSIEIALSRPWFAFEEGEGGPDGRPVVLRHLLGYGPDSFPYVLPLRQIPPVSEPVRLNRHAHNQHLNMLVEQGIFGFLVSLGMTAVPLLSGGYVLVRRAAAYPWRTRLLLLGVLSALAGRAVEQLVGVDMLADTMLSWALLGLLVGLPVGTRPTAPAALPARAVRLRLRLAVAPVAAAALVLLAALTMAQAINPLLAARDVVLADRARLRSDGFVAIAYMNRAIVRAPAVVRYRLLAVALLDEARGLDVPPQQQAAFLLSALAVLEDGLERTPLSPHLTLELASHYRDLGQYDAGGGGPLALDAYERTAALLPNYWQPKRDLGIVLLEAGRPADALALLSEVVDVLGDAEPVDDIRPFLEAALGDVAQRAAPAYGRGGSAPSGAAR